ncbi:kinesin-associated protein 3 isoform X1 [Parasteatoda tepidariorum]|uniref:kinesin-associated protein 3 isoform X1 n=1 Tax=Parasteatoda tepidariorum TaxID=114398 RepID=UPI001C71FE3D|nr:kinesin-associated protein 3 isoform X2 [Parasteatoda tepidariorum]
MHQQDEEQHIQRYVRFQHLDVHPTQNALIINYDVDPNMLAQLNDFMLKGSRDTQKVVRLKGSFDTDEIQAIAQAIIDTCPLVPPTKLTEVEQLLYYLHTRKGSTEEVNTEDVETNSSDSDLIPSDEESASVTNVDSYIELLYEEIPEKIRASALVLQLARETGNLNVLRKNEILLGALARVLREDGRKSIELSTNIVHVFCCFSVFSQFHPLLAQHKVGSLCIDVVDGELKRYEQWSEEIAKKKVLIDSGKSSPAMMADYEKSFQKYLTLVKKQNQLLRVCFLLLSHIAEDRKVENKMVNRGIVGLLSKSLSRELPELLILVVTFLMKLSIYIENKEEMEFNCIVEQVAHLIPHENSELLSAVLKLLLNLSFSIESRNSMVKCGLLQKLVTLMSVKAHLNEVLGILYHISFDDRCKSLFTYTDCIPLTMKMIVEHSDTVLPKYLIALAVNLAANKRNAQLMCENDGLRRLVERAFHYQDCLLLKMIRNISQHDGPTKILFVAFADLFCEAIHRSTGKNDDFVLECVGIMGNLTIPELDYEMLLFQYDLLGFMKKKLSQGNCEDDMILEVIILAGTFSAEEVCATTLLESGMIKHVIEHLNAKQEDDEIVLHIVYLFYQLIYHRATREVIIKDTQIPGYLLDLMHDKNTEIRKLCDRSLEIISEYNEEWAKKIQIEKFRWHNCQWLEMIESQQLDEADFYGEDSYTPRIQDFLNPSDLLYGSGAYESLLSDESLSPDVLDDLPPAKSIDSASCRPKSRYKNRIPGPEQ